MAVEKVDVWHKITGARARLPKTAVKHFTEYTTTAPQDAYDPSAHTVDEVQGHLSGAEPAERDRVVAAEKSGKNRSTITSTEG